MNTRKLIIIGVFAGIIIVPFIVFAIGVLRRAPQSLPPETLTVWTVFDEEDDFTPIVASFQAAHRNVTVEVVQKRMETYEQELVEAWARGAGPDVFAIPSSWVGKYEDFITPLPDATRVAYYQDRKFLWKTDTVVEVQNDPSLTPRDVRSNFVDVVGKDVIRNEQVYGLPLSMDTLLLYYNRDLLNSAQIVNPATTWEELVRQVPQLTLLDQTGALIQSGVALGTAENMERPEDLLALLMMQNGTLMTDATERKVIFDQLTSEEFSPGERALTFYTDFANLGKEVYSWNDTQPNALDAFLAGGLAYFFGYGYHEEQITARGGNLNWGKTDMLHLNDNGTDNDARTGRAAQLNFANYWVYSTAAQSDDADLAWNFIQFAANANRVQTYLERTGRVSALRSVLASQVDDPDRSIIARQALSARNWYRGENGPRADEVLRDLITSVNAGESTFSALSTAAKQMQLTYQER